MSNLEALLFYTLEHSPANILQIITQIHELSPEKQAWFLTRADANGNNALMLAAKHNPVAVQPLLDMIANASAEEQHAILTHANNAGFNALLLSTRHQPEVFDRLVNAIFDGITDAKNQMTQMSHSSPVVSQAKARFGLFFPKPVAASSVDNAARDSDSKHNELDQGIALATHRM